MKQKAVFERISMTNGSKIIRGIKMYRKPDGSVELRITVERRRHDLMSLPYILSANEAAKLGRALLCIDDTNFEGLIERSQTEATER